ncbi:MAG: prepilin-type N-terminal cleavage/methylation domain-containing protein [Kiritimatiellae bacterium]|nr:prepilin-type N-terminal cleavage/methylation domain-containing protein [Kiritimatiellia bacterium]
MKRSGTTAGFTLIELTLVLFVLALVAHLGMRELSGVRARKLRDAADRQLESLAAAVYDDSDGVPRGFLSDMGRLPFASRSVAGDPLDLRELWEKPAGVGELRARPATVANLAPGAPSAIADPTLFVPCGWGGPYLRLPQSASRLRDPWGNPFENPDTAGLARLLDASGDAISATNVPVAAIRHFGADAARDADRAPAGFEQADALRAFPTNAAGVLATFEAGTVSRIVWYAPLGDKITGGEVPVDAGRSQALLADLPPGVRFLKAVRTDGSSRVLQVSLRPGRDAAVEF